MSLLVNSNTFPDELLHCDPKDTFAILGGPALIHLQGRKTRPLFVSVMQHGNEHTGFKAIQKVMKKYQAQELPRSLSIFIGNVFAARESQRRLDDQVDYNRVWPGHQYGECEETAMMQSIYDDMLEREVFASIDIHNNTGLNPHYACINRIDNRFIYLANLFSRTIVYFTRPLGVQSMAFAQICPSVTVECGQIGQVHGEDHAVEFIESMLHLSEFPAHDISPHDYNLYSTVGIVRLSKDVSFSFRDQKSDIVLEPDLDYMNFREIKPGTRLGRYRDNSAAGLEVWNNDGKNVAKDFFQFDHNEILFAKPVMPSMLTTNEQIIRQDCLCYLMERFSVS